MKDTFYPVTAGGLRIGGVEVFESADAAIAKAHEWGYHDTTEARRVEIVQTEATLSDVDDLRRNAIFLRRENYVTIGNDLDKAATMIERLQAIVCAKLGCATPALAFNHDYRCPRSEHYRG